MLLRTVKGKREKWTGRNDRFTSNKTGETVRLTARIVEEHFSDEDLAEYGLERAATADPVPSGKAKVPNSERFEPLGDGTYKQVFELRDSIDPASQTLSKEDRFQRQFGMSIDELKELLGLK